MWRVEVFPVSLHLLLLLLLLHLISLLLRFPSASSLSLSAGISRGGPTRSPYSGLVSARESPRTLSARALSGVHTTSVRSHRNGSMLTRNSVQLVPLAWSFHARFATDLTNRPELPVDQIPSVRTRFLRLPGLIILLCNTFHTDYF